MPSSLSASGKPSTVLIDEVMPTMAIPRDDPVTAHTMAGIVRAASLVTDAFRRLL